MYTRRSRVWKKPSFKKRCNFFGDEMGTALTIQTKGTGPIQSITKKQRTEKVFLSKLKKKTKFYQTTKINDIIVQKNHFHPNNFYKRPQSLNTNDFREDLQLEEILINIHKIRSNCRHSQYTKTYPKLS